jgi:hypothetical protein
LSALHPRCHTDTPIHAAAACSTSSAYSPAKASSSITPMPRFTRRSAQLTGQGLRMSNARKSRKPTSSHDHPAGAASSAIHKPMNSSQTTTEGS